jgi:hypothetical protein
MLFRLYADAKHNFKTDIRASLRIYLDQFTDWHAYEQVRSYHRDLNRCFTILQREEMYARRIRILVTPLKGSSVGFLVRWCSRLRREWRRRNRLNLAVHKSPKPFVQFIPQRAGCRANRFVFQKNSNSHHSRDYQRDDLFRHF